MEELMKYPQIYATIAGMAAANGLVNRFTSVEQIYAVAEQALHADGVDTADLTALDAWIAGLTREERNTLEDGEEAEAHALMETSPTSASSGLGVAFLLNDVWEALTESEDL